MTLFIIILFIFIFIFVFHIIIILTSNVVGIKVILIVKCKRFSVSVQAQQTATTKLEWVAANTTTFTKVTNSADHTSANTYSTSWRRKHTTSGTRGRGGKSGGQIAGAFHIYTKSGRQHQNPDTPSADPTHHLTGVHGSVDEAVAWTRFTGHGQTRYLSTIE